MANPSKRKGTDAENKVRDLFKRHWPETERRAQEGSQDKGDLINVPRTCVEVKAEKGFHLGPWLKEAEVERSRLGARWGIVVHKRIGTTDAAKWFATMEGATALDLIRLANLALDAGLDEVSAPDARMRSSDAASSKHRKVVRRRPTT